MVLTPTLSEGGTVAQQRQLEGCQLLHPTSVDMGIASVDARTLQVAHTDNVKRECNFRTCPSDGNGLARKIPRMINSDTNSNASG